MSDRVRRFAYPTIPHLDAKIEAIARGVYRDRMSAIRADMQYRDSDVTDPSMLPRELMQVCLARAIGQLLAEAGLVRVLELHVVGGRLGVLDEELENDEEDPC